MAGATGHRPFFLLVSSLPNGFDEIKETSQMPAGLCSCTCFDRYMLEFGRSP